MKNTHQDTKNTQKTIINPVVTAITGAVVGAGVVTAGILALKDKKISGKVNRALADVKKKTAGTVEKIQQEVFDIEALVIKDLAEASKQITNDSSYKRLYKTNHRKQDKNANS